MPGRPITCDDCWFRRELLCALDLPEPCPTFREARGGLRPPRHPRLVELQREPEAVGAGAEPAR